MTRVPGNACITVPVCLSPSDSAMLVRNTLWGKNKTNSVAHFLVGSPRNERVVIHWLWVSRLIGFKITQQKRRRKICQLTIKHFQLRSVWNGLLRWLQLPELHTKLRNRMSDVYEHTFWDWGHDAVCSSFRHIYTITYVSKSSIVCGHATEL